jgi:hypothetical protein
LGFLKVLFEKGPIGFSLLELVAHKIKLFLVE